MTAPPVGLAADRFGQYGFSDVFVYSHRTRRLTALLWRGNKQNRCSVESRHADILSTRQRRVQLMEMEEAETKQT